MFNPFLANSYNSFHMTGIGFGLFTIGAIFFLLLTLAVVALKGYALWTAAKRDEKGWFIALLLINTLGVLELVYLYFVVGKWKTVKTVESINNTPKETPSAPSTPPTTPSGTNA